ncbi:hypothetical protein KGF54_001089 [Candida jiufengensis]|uniref:uncharacterized protein n=1 Tax=Candida jiufengensis TaxID=497108 RepID=UPI00222522B0|nr:uncharacterized protein KGF54_001089 [Candida jiufengensis]KAI5956614.1 hypothetical protein KGF54_001089 [Candida jiufengensis]
MAKRQATEQITKDAFHGDFDENEDNGNLPVKASSQVLSTRKILKPRSKLGGDQNGTASPTPFKIQQNTFSFNPPTKPTRTTNEKDYKIKALNENFIQKINELNKVNTITNFTKIAEKYIAYYKEIDVGKENQFQQSTFQSQQASQPSINPPKEIPIAESHNNKSESESEDDNKEIKIQGPTFTFNKSTTTKSPFTFDPKKIAKINAPDSDESEDEVEIKGPTFNFNKEIKDNVFKFPTNSTNSTSFFNSNSTNSVNNQTTTTTTFNFNSTQPKPATTTTTTTPFNFGTNNASSPGNNKPTEVESSAKPVISFNSSSNTTEPNKPFTFGSTDNSNSAFSFTSSNKPTTAFANSTNESNKGFSFGATNKSTDATKDFSFGSVAKPTTVNEESNKPSTGFSFKPAETNKGFSFKPAETNKGFSFGSTNGAAIDLTKKNDNPSDSAKGFSFGSSSSTIPKQDESNNGVSFGSTDKQSSLFGSNSYSSTPFSFGSTSATTKPSFNFASKPASNDTSTSSNNFSFGSNNKNPFGGISSTTEASKEKDDDATAAEEEPEVVGNFTPVTQMNEKQEVQSGEENEEIKYTIRAKLLEFDANNSDPYNNKGLGDLKILHNKTTDKSRILIRAEGSLRILLNTLISKDIKYDAMGNGSLIRVPVFENGKVVTYVIKVKTADDGKTLLNTINESK